MACCGSRRGIGGYGGTTGGGYGGYGSNRTGCYYCNCHRERRGYVWYVMNGSYAGRNRNRYPVGFRC